MAAVVIVRSDHQETSYVIAAHYDVDFRENLQREDHDIPVGMN